MSPRQLELALKKQRLQIRSGALREAFADYAAGAAPAFTVADRVHAGWFWLRRHPVLPIGVLAALLAARPRKLLHWAKRGFFVWQALRKLSDLIAIKLPGGH